MKKHFFLLPALFAVACDVQDELADGGEVVIDAGAGETPKDPVYRWVLVTDTSTEMNAFGAPGADICGVRFDCGGGVAGSGIHARLWAGDGEFCRAGGQVNGEDCFADRNDPSAAVGEPHDPCEADSNPSHYVALGVGGVLAVQLETEDGDLRERGLAGCAITVLERLSRDQESYQVSICADDKGVQCMRPVPVADAPEGGEVQLIVPTP